MQGLSKETWRGGTEHELRFWEWWLRERGGPRPENFAKRFDPAAPLELDTRHVDLPGGGELHVLDVGAGPASSVGKVLPGYEVHLVPVDPLADDYARLLDEAGLRPPVPTRRGEAEELVEAVGEERFDIVHCRNALDHSYDPLRALGQMLAAARPGGTILLLHRENEGEHEQYAGFHAWNLTERDGRFVIWRGTEQVHPDEILGGIDWVRVERRSDWIAVAIRKSATRSGGTSARSRAARWLRRRRSPTRPRSPRRRR